MNILLLGGSGRCGSLVRAALIAQGVHVRAPGSIELDLARMQDAAAWQPWLDGADAVIHTAGVLRETGSDTFAAHLRAMQTLAHAVSARCAAGRVTGRVTSRVISRTTTRATNRATGAAQHTSAGGTCDAGRRGCHLVLLSAAGANAASAVPWFAAKGAAEACLLSEEATTGPLATAAPVTIVRAGALYLDATGSPRRFHPQALTLDWRRATGHLPLTPMIAAVAALLSAALGAAPQAHALIDLTARPLARAA